MEKEIIYEDKNLRLEFYPQGGYLHETWWGMTFHDSFIKLLDIIIKSLEKNEARGLLLDAREHKGLSPAMQELAAKRHEEYAKKYGFLKQAIIVPKDVFSKFSVKNYTRQFDEEYLVENMYFDNIEEAKKWLHE